MTPDLLERLTAWTWLLFALIGVVIRARRIWIFWGMTATDPDDAAYLRTVKRSSWLRGAVKLVFLVGGVLAVWSDPASPREDTALLFWTWRASVPIALLLLMIEDIQVEWVRARLGRRGGTDLGHDAGRVRKTVEAES